MGPFNIKEFFPIAVSSISLLISITALVRTRRTTQRANDLQISELTSNISLTLTTADLTLGLPTVEQKFEVSQKARKLLADAESVDKDHPKVCLSRAKILLADGDAESALNICSRITKRDPKMHEAHCLKARCLIRLNRLLEAKKSIKKAKNTHALTCENTAISESMILASSGEIDAAVAILETAVKEKSGSAILNYNLGALLTDHNLDHNKAIAHFQNAIAATGRRPLIMTAQAKALHRSGDTRLAKIILDDALILNPNFLPALIDRAQLSMLDQDYEMTYELVMRIQALDPQCLADNKALALVVDAIREAIRE